MVISIRQPFAWLIANGHKDIENRTWTTRYRGPIAIHAASRPASLDAREYAYEQCEELGIELPAIEDLQRGGIVGAVNLVDVVTKHSSPWYNDGDYGFVLAQPEERLFYPLKGDCYIFPAVIPDC